MQNNEITFLNKDLTVRDEHNNNVYTLFHKQILGKGQFSEVYKCFKQNGPTGDFAARVFIREKTATDVYNKELEMSKLIGSLNSENVLRTFDIIEQKELTFIITDLCQGNLLNLMTIHNYVQFDIEIVLNLIIQIVEAVDILHKNNIAHRDIKPENILFKLNSQTQQPYLILADFGISVQFKPGKDTFRRVQGTLYYMSPEMHADNFHSYEMLPADIWAIAILFDELLRGEYFFYHDDEEIFIKQIQTKQYYFNITPDSDLKKAVIEEITKCLDKNHKNRPNSFTLLENLKRIKNQFCQKFKLPPLTKPTAHLMNNDIKNDLYVQSTIMRQNNKKIDKNSQIQDQQSQQFVNPQLPSNQPPQQNQIPEQNQQRTQKFEQKIDEVIQPVLYESIVFIPEDSNILNDEEQQKRRACTQTKFNQTIQDIGNYQNIVNKYCNETKNIDLINGERQDIFEGIKKGYTNYQQEMKNLFQG